MKFFFLWIQIKHNSNILVKFFAQRKLNRLNQKLLARLIGTIKQS